MTQSDDRLIAAIYADAQTRLREPRHLDEASAFEAVAGKKGCYQVVIGRFWLEKIVGDLSISIKEVRRISLVEELDYLCDVLENAMK
ncbi:MULTISPECIES: hypothetical protein [unclassified Halomonas]|uniref:hypothetical protein n=1 Tax=unclassified Halomonas TaxID=2609666 RepID=UPI0024686CBE|nr:MULTISPECIES: hypothetical protein [unclassified Halomonas]